MAKIPTGNFGNLVPQGTPGAKLNPNAYSSGDGLVRAGDTLMRVAGAALSDQRQEQAQITDIARRGEVADHRSKVESFLDGFGKDAGLPGSDMNRLSQQLDAIDEYGKTAYGSAWEKKKQDTKDKMWFSNLTQQVLDVSSNLNGIRQLKAAIKTGPYADKLDPNNRLTLETMLEGKETALIQRQEAAAQRSQREHEQRLSNAEAAFNVFQTTRVKGGYLSPEFTDKTIAETKGTIYEQAVMDSIKQAKEIGGLASQPIGAQKQLLSSINTRIAKEGRSPELDKQRDQVDKVLSASITDVKNSGIRAGFERGVIDRLEPIDFSSPTTLFSSIGKRVHAAQLVSAWAKDFVPAVSPLDNEEAENVKTMFDALQPKEKSQFVGNIVSVTGPKLGGAIARQFGEKDRVLELAFAAGTSKTTTGKYVSERIFKGAKDIKDRTYSKTIMP